ncbi:PREDICTED: uncharacterized protein LOC106743061 [Dinoponera quadriceps]|uniref:Uncharacterized protein LOC106743061 n=1 Tax=Dinoponera quadriceps TaxID=609295 RepID=A0A6P3X2H3_DINQU|nr:PREDICTED: uncharacterized protein LOC106743061 [Dinoponera quadriceps]XP_014472054.1 PREDICTED: uncharacterized protein LOC106743061 [Dinoponera quadriceps]
MLTQNKMFAANLILVFIVAHATAEIPSYINVCGRKNPNLDECILKNIENLKNKICEGMPELSVPPTEPLALSKINVINSDTAKISLDNVYLRGICNFEVQSFHMDLEKRHFDVDLIFRQIKMNMTYNFNVNIIVPVAIKGPISITTDNVSAKSGVDLNVATKGNKQFVYLSNIKLDLGIKRYDANVSSFDDAQMATMREIGQHFLGNNQQELLAVLKPILEDVISKQILNFSNKIVRHFTYDELFPDRT